MSGFKKFLLVVLILILTNLMTFGFLTWQCNQRLAGKERLIEQAAEHAQDLQNQLATAKKNLERLEVWGHFIQLQQDLNSVNNEINDLNFGNAITRVDSILQKLDQAKYGSLFKERKEVLLPLLDQCKKALHQKDEKAARGSLSAINEKAFSTLSGIPPAQGFSDGTDTSTATPESVGAQPNEPTGAMGAQPEANTSTPPQGEEGTGGDGA